MMLNCWSPIALLVILRLMNHPQAWTICKLTFIPLPVIYRISIIYTVEVSRLLFMHRCHTTAVFCDLYIYYIIYYLYIIMSTSIYMYKNYCMYVYDYFFCDD